LRRRIQQMAAGIIDSARPLLSFSTDRICPEVAEGRDYTGEFTVTSTNHVPFRGFVYTPDARMECLTPQVEGEEAKIQYRFHSEGLTEGDILTGDFVLICNQGEYNLPFVVSVVRLCAETSAGKIRDLGDFVRLAKENPTEAFRLFFSRNFRQVIKPEEHREMLLYEALCQGPASAAKVEEFLLGTGRKEQAAFSIDRQEAVFWQVQESRRETLVLQRSHWGYAEVRVTSDAAFLVPEKQRLTEEDFIGSSLEIAYVIREEELHAGKNYGRLSIKLPGQTICFAVCASRGKKKDWPLRPAHRKTEEARVALLGLYVDYRLKRIVTGIWASRSVELLEALTAQNPDEEMYLLMKAQVLIINRQRQEASWIMDDFKRGCKKRHTPKWGYYLYLCTLLEREPSYVDRLAGEIEELFQKNPDSSLLFWILLFVRESYYNNPIRRYRAIGQWIRMGHRSPYLYLEAYYLIWQDPYLLRKLGPFEREVLNWARKQRAITSDIALQIMHIVPELKEFDPLVLRILEECGQVSPQNAMLGVICGYLIKGQQYGKQYHGWYEAGITNGIRLTGLYEAYLMSLDTDKIGTVPKMIQMYFQYDTRLAYPQRAILFVNIIADRQRQPGIYQRYRKSMEQFAMEQIAAGHINEHLAVIYDELLKAGMVSPELAVQLARILFAHRLVCLDPGISRAVIRHEELSEPQTVTVTDGEAYFFAYTKNYSIVLEDTDGNSYYRSIRYHDEPMLHPDGYLERCMSLAPSETSYLLYDLRGSDERWAEGKRRADVCRKLLEVPEISERFRAKLAGVCIEDCRKRLPAPPDRGFTEYLKREGTDWLPAAVRRQLTLYLMEAGRYEKAYPLVKADGFEHLDEKMRMLLAGDMIVRMDFEEDDFLLGLAADAFLHGMYNEDILLYLCRYYNGPTEQMVKLWKTAEECLLDTFELEERILIQTLFTGTLVEGTARIYENYYAGGGREQVCMAYLTWSAHCYLTEDTAPPRHVFLQLKDRYYEGESLGQTCRLGLLKYLANRKHLTEKQMDLADELLSGCMEQNIYFAFYRRFPAELVRKYHLCDRYFLECRRAPDRRVVVHYRLNQGAYQTADMAEMYAGIYVREFVLFAGETLQYFITEDAERESAKKSGSVCIAEDEAAKDWGRYTQLNLMQNAWKALGESADQPDDSAGVRAKTQCGYQMKNYYGLLRLTEEAFRLL
jgi:hypothetical protein